MVLIPVRAMALPGVNYSQASGLYVIEQKNKKQEPEAQ